jgi:hypothetical protein
MISNSILNQQNFDYTRPNTSDRTWLIDQTVKANQSASRSLRTRPSAGSFNINTGIGPTPAPYNPSQQIPKTPYNPSQQIPKGIVSNQRPYWSWQMPAKQQSNRPASPSVTPTTSYQGFTSKAAYDKAMSMARRDNRKERKLSSLRTM